MATQPLSDEVLTATVEALAANGGNVTATATSIGVPRATLQNRIHRAAERGLMGTDPVMPGYYISSTTVTPNGGKFIQQRKEHGDEFSVPEGHTVKGVSALIDSEGRTIQQWIKTREEQSAADAIAIIKDAFADVKPVKPVKAPVYSDKDLLTLTPCNDWHVGLYTWAEESGENWDLKKAERVIGDNMQDVVDRSPASGRAIVLGGGDLMHADNMRNETERSGNSLDVDGRYQKVMGVANRLMVRTIDAHLKKHKHVTGRILRGNHDEHSSIAVAYHLAAWYRNEPRVTIDLDPSLYFKYRFGNVMLAATHGHEAKIGDLPGIMASLWPKEWGATVCRYAHGFHLHHTAKLPERMGVACEVHQAPIPKDSWHYGKGFVSGRSIQSITYHRKFGEWSRTRVGILDAANDNTPKSKKKAA